MLQFRDLEDFLAVVEHGSVLRAAHALGVAQPVLSRRISAMERSLGAALLERRARGVTPTVHGRLLEEHARLMLGDRRRAIHALGCLRDGIEGHVRLGVAPAFLSVLPAAIARLMARRRGLTFDVTYGTFDALMQSLRLGEIDAAFSLVADQHGIGDEWKVRPLLRDQVEVVCAAGHPLRRRRKVEFANLADERWALMNRPRSVVEAFHRISAERGLASPRVAVESDSLDLVKTMVMDGGCLSLLPRGAVAGDLNAERMGTLRVGGLPQVAAGVIHRDGVLPPAIELLVEEIASVVHRG